MITSDILDKRSICHGFISSTSKPDVLIPFKGVIEDIQFHENFPRYSIKIIKFYDNVYFLKEFLGDGFYQQKFEGKPKPVSIPNTIKTVPELEDWIGSCRFVVETNFVVKTKNEMMELFKKLQEYLIAKAYREIQQFSVRPLLESPLRLESKIELKARIKRMYGDKFKSIEDLDSFLDYI
jgi:hypothetical protein